MSHLLVDWVVLTGFFSVPTVCPVLPGLMGIWQKRLGSGQDVGIQKSKSNEQSPAFKSRLVFFASKVASDTPFLGHLWTDLAKILVDF